jgi:hypothetical protein
LRCWFLAALLVFALPTFALAADSYQINSGANVDITEHGQCRRVTNNHASGLPIFVSTKTSTEWSSFYGSTIPGVTVAACPASCAGTSIGGYCWYFGAAGQSRNTVCASRGGTTAGSISYVGSSGTLANCQAVMQALGYSALTYTDNTSTTAGGLGCTFQMVPQPPTNQPMPRVMRWPNIATTQAASYAPSARACSCAQ